MSIQETIDQDLNSALKSQDQIKVDTLRLIKSAIKNAEIEKGKPLADVDVLLVLNRQAKTRKESIDLYKKGQRNELAAKEEKELEIINAYLPEEMPEEEIKTKVIDAIKETDASGPQDMGKVMGKVMAELKGQVSGDVVSKIVKDELSKS